MYLVSLTSTSTPSDHRLRPEEVANKPTEVTRPLVTPAAERPA